jgi:transcriptional regulator with XRE-family HTH domain
LVPDKNAKRSLLTFGGNLRRLRNAAGFSQDALAAKADVTKRYVQMLEAGQKCPTLFTLKRLRFALDCRYEDLLSGF